MFRFSFVAISLFLVTSSSLRAATDSPIGDATSPLDFSQCLEPSGPIRADNSPNSAYFEELLQRGAKEPLSDFLKLWYPDRKGAVDAEANSDECKKEEDASFHGSGANGNFVTPFPANQRRCLVDTVYSWGPKEKLLALQKSMPDNGSWLSPPNPGHTLDTALSAVGTFGYGIVPVRIKLRPGFYGLPTELIFDTGRTIESWSFGTPEQYDEIVRDYLRYQSKKPWVGFWALGNGNDLYLEWPLDGHDFTEDALKNELLEMIRMILNGEGRIYYAAGTCRNRQLEFETRFPTYIDPFPVPNATDVARPKSGSAGAFSGPSESAGEGDEIGDVAPAQ